MAYITGTNGNDTLNGSGSADTIYGLAGNDTINAKGGNDLVYGGSGNDSIYGKGGSDTIYGESGADYLVGDDGNDTIDGGADNDQIYGEDDHDTLRGGLGDDNIFGGNGNDYLYGDDGNDWLDGGTDQDSLYGGAGNDVLVGKEKNDQLWGGSGADVFRYVDHDSTGKDTIHDFERGIDKIDLSAMNPDRFSSMEMLSDQDRLFKLYDGSWGIRLSGDGQSQLSQIISQGVEVEVEWSSGSGWDVDFDYWQLGQNATSGFYTWLSNEDVIIVANITDYLAPDDFIFAS